MALDIKTLEDVSKQFLEALVDDIFNGPPLVGIDWDIFDGPSYGGLDDGDGCGSWFFLSDDDQLFLDDI